MKKPLAAMALAACACCAYAQSLTDANRIFELAESRFASLFPGQKANAIFGPILYRYYPETRMYVGVVVNPDANFQLNGVYALGGPFTGVTYVGQTSAFLATGDNGCFDFARLYVTGRRSVTTMRVTGSRTSTDTFDETVNGPTTFQGRAVVQSTLQVSTSQSSRTHVTYFVLTAPSELTAYGTSLTFAGSSTSTTTYSAAQPFVDARGRIPLGESVTIPVTATTATTINANFRWRYAARESVTVPAGTFTTCRFDILGTAPGETTISGSIWVIAGLGIVIKSSGNGETSEATSVTINGAAP